jgi:hypothetical protein
MKTTLAILTMFLLLASHAAAQPAPSGVPIFKIVDSTDKAKGQITFLETVTRAVPERKDVAVNIDGMQVIKIVTSYVFVYEQRTTTIDAAKSRFITPDGKQLPIDEVWKRLKKDTVVVVSGDDTAPAQAYLRALSPDTLVIISRRPEAIVAPAAQPKAVPKLPPPPKN